MATTDDSAVSSSDAPSIAAGDELPEHLLGKLRLKVPGYRLQCEIGAGGQAVVYKATQNSTGKTVAVKVLREGPMADPTARERLQREVRVLAALNHPNIVTVLDSGQTDHGHDFLVMNFIAGPSLDEWIKINSGSDNKSVESAAVLGLFIKICEAVHAAHLGGITHRDLSPNNIRIDARGEPHILDFGLARTVFDRATSQSRQDISISGQFLGKLPYASPEQARGEPGKIDIRTDVYTLGVILYQILTGGHFPYEVAGNIAEVLNNIIYTRPTPPSKRLDAEEVQAHRRIKKQHPPVVNEIIEAIVLKALEKEPADRYQSAGELSRGISNYLAGRPTMAVAAPTIAPSAVAAPVPAKPPNRVPIVGSFTVLPKSWKRTAILALLAGIVAAAACGAVFAARYYSILHELQSHSEGRGS